MGQWSKLLFRFGLASRGFSCDKMVAGSGSKNRSASGVLLLVVSEVLSGYPRQCMAAQMRGFGR